MLDFCLKVWMYLIAIGVLVVLIRLPRIWKETGSLWKWGALSFLVFSLHLIEESKIPGGYWFLVNKGVPGYPLNAVSYMILSLIVFALACLALMRGLGNIPAIVFMVFTAKETSLHCVVLVRESLRICGYFYAPGFVTALLGFFPLSMVLLVKVIERRPRSAEFCLGIAMSVLFIALLNILETQVLTAFSSYAFTDPGFYSSLG